MTTKTLIEIVTGTALLAASVILILWGAPILAAALRLPV